MAVDVTIKIVGGRTIGPGDYTGTVGDIKDEYDLEDRTATVNGSSVSDDHEVADYNFITLAPSSKGGC